MQVKVLFQLDDNYAYLVIAPGGEAAVVDPAEATVVEQALEETGARLVAILCTHHHGDHVAGVPALHRHHRLEVYGHRAEENRIPHLSQPVDEGSEILLGRSPITVLHTPGHTRGSVCYLTEDAIFTGDTLFVAGCGRLFEGDAATLYRSVSQRLRSLPPRLKVYCGHEYAEKNLSFALRLEPDNETITHRLAEARRCHREARPFYSTMAQELEHNPFLRLSGQDIRRAVGEVESQAPLSEQEVFARLRRLRDVY